MVFKYQNPSKEQVKNRTEYLITERVHRELRWIGLSHTSGRLPWGQFV